MMKNILLLVLVGYCLNSITARFIRPVDDEEDVCSLPDQGFDCPVASGLFPHDECRKFWHCSNCYAYAKDCPADLVFNPEILVCDWQTSVNVSALPCELNPLTTTTTIPETTTTGVETTTGSGGEDSGDAEEGTTTEGSAGGDDTTTANPGEETTTELTTTDTPTTGAESTTPLTGLLPDCRNFPDPPNYFPHPDCTKFYQCAPGPNGPYPQVQDCAPGTAWVQELLTCDHIGPNNCPEAGNGGNGGDGGNGDNSGEGGNGDDDDSEERPDKKKK